MITFKKDERKKLSRSFNSGEFECRCAKDCGEQSISKELIDKLQLVRDELGIPLVVTSAFRCAEHQERLRGSGIKTAVGRSTHEDGIAADITVPVGKMPKLLAILEKHFKAIGIARNFYHVDLRDDKERRWKY
jgi:uncharacterized protein YcbK (DUF882 family)